tara:strand:+ start:2727 stop:3656 length:930 start_codon:yes stop_codon:yes gene_type:complete
METYKIYALGLQQNKWIIHLSEKENANDLMIEAIVTYPFMQKYAPIIDIRKTNIQDFLEIDYFVKKYMRTYGIDNVRGGSYQEENIPENMKNVLIHELNNTFLKFQEKTNGLDQIVDKYKTTLSWDEEKINEEIKELEKNNNLIQKLKDHIDQLSYLNKDTDYEIKIDDSILETANWLEHKILQENRVITVDDINKYNNFILIVYGLYFTFSNFIVNRMTKQVHMYVEQPRILFDSIIYKNKELQVDEKEMCSLVISDIKYMYNCIINTRDELEYDYTNLPYYNNSVNSTIVTLLKEVLKNKNQSQSLS